MSEDISVDKDKQTYKLLTEQKSKLEEDLKLITNIYGKITTSHDYKEFARKTNSLMERVSSRVKEINAKIKQWDEHFKSQAAYNEILGHEKTIAELWDKYL